MDHHQVQYIYMYMYIITMYGYIVTAYLTPRMAGGSPGDPEVS